MARRLKTDGEIDRFIAKVLTEAKHHSGNVAGIIVPLSDSVRARLDLNHDTVSIYERNGKLARTCWVVLNGKRYCFSYNYTKKQIDLRDKSTQGHVLCSFNNATSQSTIDTEVALL